MYVCACVCVCVTHTHTPRGERKRKWKTLSQLLSVDHSAYQTMRSAARCDTQTETHDSWSWAESLTQIATTVNSSCCDFWLSNVLCIWYIRRFINMMAVSFCHRHMLIALTFMKIMMKQAVVLFRLSCSVGTLKKCAPGMAHKRSTFICWKSSSVQFNIIDFLLKSLTLNLLLYIITIPFSVQERQPAEFKHINKRRKRNQMGFP